MRLIARPAPAGDLEDAFLWDKQRRSELGHDFLAALQSVFETLLSNPTMFSIVHRGNRRALLRRFPYGVYCRVLPEVIVVVACMHGRRIPCRWHARMTSTHMSAAKAERRQQIPSPNSSNVAL